MRNLADGRLGAGGVDGERQQVAVAAVGGAGRARSSASSTASDRARPQAGELVDLELARTAELSTLSTSIGALARPAGIC